MTTVMDSVFVHTTIARSLPDTTMYVTFCVPACTRSLNWLIVFVWHCILGSHILTTDQHNYSYAYVFAYSTKAMTLPDFTGSVTLCLSACTRSLHWLLVLMWHSILASHMFNYWPTFSNGLCIWSFYFNKVITWHHCVYDLCFCPLLHSQVLSVWCHILRSYI